MKHITTPIQHWLRESLARHTLTLMTVVLLLGLGSSLSWASSSQIVSLDVQTKGNNVDASLMFTGDARKYRVYQSGKRISIRFRGTGLLADSGKLNGLPAPFTKGYLSQISGDVVMTLYSETSGKELLRTLVTTEEDGLVTFSFKGVAPVHAAPVQVQRQAEAAPVNKDKVDSLDDLLNSLHVNQATAEMRQPDVAQQAPVQAETTTGATAEEPTQRSDALLASLMKEKGLNGSPATQSESSASKPWSSTRWLITMVMLGLMSFGAWYLKKVRSPLAGFDKSEVKVLANKQISMKSRLVLVEVDGERLLFSVGDGGMKLAHKFDEKESVDAGDLFDSAAEEFRAKEAVPPKKETVLSKAEMVSHAAVQSVVRSAALKNSTSNLLVPQVPKAKEPDLPPLPEPRDFQEKAQALSQALAQRKAAKASVTPTLSAPKPSLAAAPVEAPSRLEQSLSKREREQKRKGSVQDFLSQFSNKVDAASQRSAVKSNSRFGRAVATTMQSMMGN